MTTWIGHSYRSPCILDQSLSNGYHSQGSPCIVVVGRTNLIPNDEPPFLCDTFPIVRQSHNAHYSSTKPRNRSLLDLAYARITKFLA
jgi:hypothetical protein